MGYARYVGRIGALAITLGVGWAVATAAPAYADDSGASGGSESPASSASASASPASASPASASSATGTSASARSDRKARAEKRQEAREAAQTRRAERRAARQARDTDTDDTAASATVVTVATDPVAQAPSDPDPAAPLAATTMLTAAAVTREENARNTLRRNVAAATPQAAELVADPPNILVIGVDGTNLSKILADPLNANLFGLMQDGTTAASTIVGHTTISNPSWTSILTGAWGEKTGVVNNVFTPWTYDKWPTVFNQLETLDGTIETTAISDWDVIAGIAGAGSIPADNNIYFTQVAGDTDWSKTDDRVGDATEAAIALADPTVGNFIFSYFVGVDENGHMFGGDSPQYAAAIRNVDRNIGEILQAVDDWETLTGEQWTILVVTDHGHQPDKGFSHGFQSPRETSTFVIADGPGVFPRGAINLAYSIVDITPTVMTLFGSQPAPDSDGVSLTTLNDRNVFPLNDDAALRGALQDIIAKYGYPDIGTQLSLSLRTLVTSVPYFVFGFTNQITAGLQDLVDRGIPLISLVAKIAIVPVQLIGDFGYAATNLAAQVVAKLTGVEGASIFPLWPPVPPSVEPAPEEPTTLLDLVAFCGDDPASATIMRCNAPSVAV